LENLCALRAQSNAYAEFVGALGNEIGEHTVEPGSGQDQCDDGEAQDEKRVELGAERGLFDGFAKSLHVGDRQIAIHGIDYTLNGYGKRFDVAGGANKKGGGVIAMDWHVEGRIVGLTDSPARVARDADNLEDFTNEIDSQALAEGIFVGEIAISGVLADEDHVGVVETLPRSESTTAQNGYSGCGEMLPDGLSEHLTPEQFEAIVAHELCHVRRRDNLSSAIHMVVESLFWFHPLVWWIQARLVEERERACDEAVLQMGSDPQDYAEGIVTVCEFYLRSPLVCLSGVTGSDLKRRVETIMLNRAAESMDIGRKLLLFVGAVLALTVPLIVGVLNAPSIRAQEPAKPVPQQIATSALPEFEVASIKPSAPDSNLKVDFAAGGKLFITNATLRFLIKIAYDIGDDQLAGGPGWIGSKRFDLAAVPERALGASAIINAIDGDPKSMAPDRILVLHKPVRLRLQRLLADRFQLELRRESTPMPAFALVLARGGPKKLTVTKSTGDSQLKFGNGVLEAVGVDMATLAKFLSEGQTGRPVVDMTGLKDKYDFHLEWAPDTSPNFLPADSGAQQQPADASGISIFTALQQQLGLKLDARTGAADRLVVSRAELPLAN
jgi:uncharacterized protein (TIGR03435 family)